MYGSIKLTVTSKTPAGESTDIVLSQPTIDEEDHAAKYKIMADTVGAGFAQAVSAIDDERVKNKGKKK